MADPSDVKYVTVEGTHIAFRTLGSSGPVLLTMIDWFSNVDAMFEPGPLADALHSLARFARVVVFDKRGVGLSDPPTSGPLSSLDDWVDDIAAVLDAVKAPEAAILAVGAAGPMALTYCAAHPDRVSGLILVNSYARLARADDYPAGVPDALRERVLQVPLASPTVAAGLGGSSSDRRFIQWWTRYHRNAASPGVAAKMRAMLFDVDVRAVLPLVRTPTLILHRRDDGWIRAEHSHVLAGDIEGAMYEELDGSEDIFYLGDVDALCGRIEHFVTGGLLGASDGDQMLATLMFSDIAKSTQLAVNVGNQRWSAKQASYKRITLKLVDQWRGFVSTWIGDGALCVFDSPTRAVRCAIALRDATEGSGIDVRAGIHSGEITRRSTDEVIGLAVHIASRVSDRAQAGEIVVSRTVCDLVVGSGFTFGDHGLHHLKGLEGSWQLFRVVDAETSASWN